MYKEINHIAKKLIEHEQGNDMASQNAPKKQPCNSFNKNKRYKHVTTAASTADQLSLAHS